MKDTLILAHYYTTPEVQEMADFVGDSLDLAMCAAEEKPKRIVFAGVRFMAETAKILNPETEVILPDEGSTCSLVTQTNIEKLKEWREQYHDFVHVAYINSSAEHKATADIIVTSRIVDDVIGDIYAQGKKVIFSPDYNMGAYLNSEYGYSMPLWTAVCEVHNKFKAKELRKLLDDEPGCVLAHPESPLPVLKMADFIGSTRGMLNFIKSYVYDTGTFYVATEEGLLHNMREMRPTLNIVQAPVYGGCACNRCFYMKLNTTSNIEDAIAGNINSKVNCSKIDYLTDEQMGAARRPIERMMEFEKTGEVNLA